MRVLELGTAEVNLGWHPLKPQTCGGDSNVEVALVEGFDARIE